MVDGITHAITFVYLIKWMYSILNRFEFLSRNVVRKTVIFKNSLGAFQILYLQMLSHSISMNHILYHACCSFQPAKNSLTRKKNVAALSILNNNIIWNSYSNVEKSANVPWMMAEKYVWRSLVYQHVWSVKKKTLSNALGNRGRKFKFSRRR